MTTPLFDLPLPRAIARLAWPAMAAAMMVNVFNLVDAFWVGRLGTAALGGMTASAFLVWCLHAVGQLVGTGVNAVVARRVGEAAPAAAGVAGGHGLVLALAAAALVMAQTLPLREQLLGLLDLPQAVRGAALDYLTPILYGFPTMTLWYGVESIFRGSGDTRTPMIVLGLTLLVNAALDPLLIFGVGPIPSLGIAGAGWATVSSHLLGVAAGLLLLQKLPVRPRLGEGGSRLDLELLGRLVRIGAPIALSSFFFSVIYLILTPIIASFGAAPVAAIGIGHRVEGLAYFTSLGFATAAATLVGQHLGAGHPRRASDAAWSSTGYAAAALAALSICFFTLAPWIIDIFSDDPEVIGHGARYLRIIAVFETMTALELVLEGAFSGAGDSVPPMLVVIPLTGLRVPAAHLLAHRLGLGPSGIWWAISASTAIKGILMALWFRTGRWRRAQA
jgi:putative MATE family efflux protein